MRRSRRSTRRSSRRPPASLRLRAAVCRSVPMPPSTFIVPPVVPGRRARVGPGGNLVVLVAEELLELGGELVAARDLGRRPERERLLDDERRTASRAGAPSPRARRCRRPARRGAARLDVGLAAQRRRRRCAMPVTSREPVEQRHRRGRVGHRRRRSAAPAPRCRAPGCLPRVQRVLEHGGHPGGDVDRVLRANGTFASTSVDGDGARQPRRPGVRCGERVRAEARPSA